MSNGSPLLHRILFFPKNKLFSVMSNCSTNCDLRPELDGQDPFQTFQTLAKEFDRVH
jgi:hypothetical protein